MFNRNGANENEVQEHRENQRLLQHEVRRLQQQYDEVAHRNDFGVELDDSPEEGERLGVAYMNNYRYGLRQE